MRKKRSPFPLLLILAVLLAGMAWWLQERQMHRPPLQKPPGEGGLKKERTISPPPTIPRPEGVEKEPGVPSGAERIAIIIDDLGYNGENYRPFLEMGRPLTFAILPSLPYSQRIANEAIGQGREVLLHLPLEPHGYPLKNPGRGVILSSMSEEEMRRILFEDLKSIPGAVGVNNHMGSRLMEDREAMRVLLSELKRKNLYFVDSLTTNRTTALVLAKELGVKMGARGIFLDNYQDRAYIEGQLKALAQLALKKGGAIGVGHPYAVTASVLKDRLPELEIGRAHV